MQNKNKTHIICARDVTKYFGKRRVLDGVDFTLPAGVIYGISGANGSGKSVFLRILCGLVHPSNGQVEVFGQKIGAEAEFPPSTGILIESPGFLQTESGLRNLELLARIQGKVSREKIMQTLRFVGLDPLDRHPVSTYSTGMRQRLGLAQSVMEDPDLLILDEPTNGLDFDGQREIYHHLIDLRQQGKTILITSHSRDEIKILCDRAFLLADGKLTLAPGAEN